MEYMPVQRNLRESPHASRQVTSHCNLEAYLDQDRMPRTIQWDTRAPQRICLHEDTMSLCFEESLPDKLTANDLSLAYRAHV